MTENKHNTPNEEVLSEASNEEQVHQDESQETPVEETQLDESTENLDELVAELQEQVGQLQDQLLRSHAEVENIRRRSQEEVSKARRFSIESFAEQLVPVKDSLEAALAQEEQTVEIFKEGVETTLRQLTSAFDRNDLKEIAPAIGDAFNPNEHQAISSMPNPDVKANCIMQVLQKGYSISDRVLRPALVIVSAG